MAPSPGARARGLLGLLASHADFRVRPGRYRISVAPLGPDRRFGASEVEVELSAPGETRVRLAAMPVDARVPAGRTLRSVTWRRTAPADPPVEVWVEAEADGTFVPPPLPAGRYAVEARASRTSTEGYVIRRAEDAEPGGAAVVLDFTRPE